MIDPIVPLVFSVSLALLFFMASRHKLKSVRHFEAQLDAYEIIPRHLLPIVARTIPWIEMGLVFLLLIPFTRSLAGSVSAMVLFVYALAIAVNLYRGRTEIDCGCGDKPQSLSQWLLLRNGVLILGASIVALPALDRSLVTSDMIFVALFTVTLAMSYLTVDELVRNYSTIIK
jgi:hypothetical protein